MGYNSAIKKHELAISTTPTWKISKQVEWKKPEKRESEYIMSMIPFT